MVMQVSLIVLFPFSTLWSAGFRVYCSLCEQNTMQYGGSMSDRTKALFESCDIEEVMMNPFTRIGHEWMLVTAGTLSSWNTMTAAWGGFGFIWGKPAAFVFVRYVRHTYEYMEKRSHFSLSFFDERWKKALMVCGTKSGRDTDKAKETGLTPLDLTGSHHISGAALGFEQAKEMFVCRKLYSGELSPEQFAVEEIHSHYPAKDYHRMYVGEIEAVLRHL